jgi:hypothetical protein
VNVRADDLSAVPGDPRLLRLAERRELRALRLRGPRREEWIRGRVAIRHAVARWLPRASRCRVHTEPSGAPLVVGVDCSVSLSHDGRWFAVALAPGRDLRIGVDLCRRVHAGRLAPILRRFIKRGVQLDPVVQWAALECVLKLRGLGIAGLMGSDARVRRAGRRVWVAGIGPDASLRVIDRPEFVVVWGSEERQ